jgi:hypothetical protein
MEDPRDMGRVYMFDNVAMPTLKVVLVWHKTFERAFQHFERQRQYLFQRRPPWFGKTSEVTAELRALVEGRSRAFRCLASRNNVAGFGVSKSSRQGL